LPEPLAKLNVDKETAREKNVNKRKVWGKMVQRIRKKKKKLKRE
jgi:hypothetical protein